MTQDDLMLFRESLARVTASDGFFDSFYDRFVEQSEEIGAIFRHRDTTQLKYKLRGTLEMLAQSAEGQPGLALYLEMLGRTHQRLRVKPGHFEMWKTALLETVEAYDPAYSKRIGAAWAQVISKVIEQILGVISRSRKLAS